MHWIPFPDPRLPVFGLPWFEETSPHLRRLPDRLRGEVPEAVWNLSQSPSGGRIRFATSSGAMAVRLHYATHGRMHNMCTIGQMGVDLYADGRYWRSAFPAEAGDLEVTYFQGAERKRREICLYLPLYHPVSVKAVGIEEEATIEAPAAFSAPKPVVFYGTSITQGGCSSRAGLSYQAILGRSLNIDFVNLGFSGNGKGEAALARAVAEIDAACYMLDFARNNGSAAALREVYAPFLAILRAARSETPIRCVTPIFDTGEQFSPATRDNVEAMRRVIREAVAERKAGGDGRITLVEGTDLLGPNHCEGLVDGVHPNDLGFQAMAAGLAAPLRSALGLPLSANAALP